MCHIVGATITDIQAHGDTCTRVNGWKEGASASGKRYTRVNGWKEGASGLRVEGVFVICDETVTVTVM
eukprot:1544949-Karenia_brevis.AAC.1